MKHRLYYHMFAKKVNDTFVSATIKIKWQTNKNDHICFIIFVLAPVFVQLLNTNTIGRMKESIGCFKAKHYKSSVQFQCLVSAVCPRVMFIFHYLRVSLETAFNSRCQGNISVRRQLYTWPCNQKKSICSTQHLKQSLLQMRVLLNCFLPKRENLSFSEMLTIV